MTDVLLDEHNDVKIIDFGFSREFTGDMQLDSFIGSPHYAAPELLQGIKYSGAEVDIWSLGILLYVMICGKQPFKHPDMKVLYAKITKGDFEYPEFVSEREKTSFFSSFFSLPSFFFFSFFLFLSPPKLTFPFLVISLSR